MDKLILSEAELKSFPERVFARLKDSLYEAKRKGKTVEVVVQEWDDTDKIIRSGGVLGTNPGTKAPINNF